MASIAWLLFNMFRFFAVSNTGFYTLERFLCSPVILFEQIVIPLFWLIIFYYSGYYNQPFRKSRLEELLLTINSIFVGILIIVVLLLINDLDHQRLTFYQLIIGLLVTHLIPIYLNRLVITNVFTRKLHNRTIGFRTLVIGTGEKAQQTIRELNEMNYSLGFDIKGTLAVDSEPPLVDESLHLGHVSNIDNVVHSERIEEIIVAVDETSIDSLLNNIYPLYRFNIPIHVLAGEYEILCGSVRMTTIYATPMVDITSSSLSHFQKNIKQTVDIVLSAIALVLLSPLLLFIMLRIKLGSPGPVFYKQERVGLHRKKFNIIKFRSMYIDAELKGPMLSSEQDTRITSFGHFLRKYRLDELPQFWNVLRGDMSLVGPRPEREFYIKQILQRAPYYSLLHKLKPGITSWGMVKFGYARNIDEMLERLRYDILYVENSSLLVDFKILIYTIRTIFLGKGI
ncbi:MAG: sugar transferase [Bacteroidales bacterium]